MTTSNISEADNTRLELSVSVFSNVILYLTDNKLNSVANLTFTKSNLFA